jgi:hypothetical protein
MLKLTVLRDRTPVIDHTEPVGLFVSRNSKTGYSVNTSIARTCRPTKSCSTYCYGLEGRMTFPAALKTQAKNAAFFNNASTKTLLAEAKRVGRRVLKRQTFIRMFGVGDLQKGSAFFIACLARENPKLQVWTSTRKLEIAETLPDVPNLHCMLSCDASTTTENIKRARDLVRRRDGQFYIAWVRRSVDEKVPSWVTIVFEEHHIGKGRASWTPEPRACPATVDGGLAHDAACSKCRYCFTTAKRENGPALVQLRRKS